MNQSDSKSGDHGVVGNPGDLDVESIIAKLRRDLNVSVKRSVILEVLNEVIPKYKSARIQTFVPILIHREVINRLRSRQVSVATKDATTHEAIKALEAAEIVEEAVADDVAAAVLTADTLTD